LHGKRRHLQTGDPAFGAGFQRRHVLIGQIQPHHIVQESSRFVGSKAQIGGAQFGQLPPPAQTGQGVPLNASVLPAISWAYNTDLEPLKRDLERAGALLDEAGWSMDAGRGIRQKARRPLKLRLHTNAGNAVRETMAAAIAEQLAEVGIEVEVIALPWYTFLEVLYGQTFDMALVSWSGLGASPDDARFWEAERDVPGRGDSFVSYENADLSAAHTAGTSSTIQSAAES